jgi:hypothetical protein
MSNVKDILKRIFLVAFLLCTTFFSNAQSQVRAVAKTDTISIRIGEQFHLDISASIPSDAKLTFPTIADSIHKLEIVTRSAIDTLKSQDGSLATYHQSLTVTCFDSGFWVIEPFTFYYTKKGAASPDSLSTEALLMQVQTIPVDTTKEIKDIKPPVEVPFSLREALPYLITGFLAIALICFIIYLVTKRKRKPQVIDKKIPDRPAHEIAIESLKKLQEQKLWQQGFYKEYHSGVSDTIRLYIEHRFSVSAMELPSDDTLSHFRNNMIAPEAYEKLRYILQLADMVKFAKGIPVGSENELTMQHAYDFIALTKPATKEDFNNVTGKEEKEASV